jgi:hypothetical protein
MYVFSSIALIFVMIYLNSCRDYAMNNDIYVAKKEAKKLARYVDYYIIEKGLNEDKAININLWNVVVDSDYEIPKTWKNAGFAIDPWGSSYELKISKSSIFIISVGPDKKMHTSDDIKMIQNRSNFYAQ